MISPKDRPMAQNTSGSMTNDDAAATDQASYSGLEAESRNLVEQAATKASEVLDAGRDYVDRVRNTGQDYAERAYEVGKQKAEEAAFYAELGYEETVILVRRHAVTALGIAAGVGFLLGLVTARR
jgi:ElaB/YqjD/DUF883 family membrane-anchored ribosome-binding protein